MMYRVESGEYEACIDRPSPQQAAIDVLAVWEHKQNKPELSWLTRVIKKGKKRGYVYFSTHSLINWQEL